MDNSLTNKQADTFQQVKRQLVHECGGKDIDDFRILQFCRAKQYNAPRAVQAYKENKVWRLHYKIETLLENYIAPRVLEVYFPLYILGLDNEGAPILVFELGTLDVNGILNSVTVDSITKHIIQVIEVGEKYMYANLQDSRKQNWLVLIECKDFPPVFVTNRTFREMAKDFAETCSNNYPERLKVAFVINTTPMIDEFLKYLKQFLPGTVLAKLKILDNYKWEKQLKELMNPDILPECLGGAFTNDSSLTSMTPIVHGGKVPKDYFLNMETGHLKYSPGVIIYSLSVFETYRVRVHVYQENSYLKWEFETAKHSIGFGLNFAKDETRKPITIIPVERLYAVSRTESGEYFCEETGFYTFVFDNSFSRFTPKTLYYKYAVWVK